MNKLDKQALRETLLASSMYSLGSILGPLLFFGGIGWVLDKYFKTKPIILLVSIFIAFIATNVLLYQKVQKLNKMIGTYGEKEKEESVNKVKEINESESEEGKL